MLLLVNLQMNPRGLCRRIDSGAGESVVSPDEWPNVELTVRTEQHNGGDIQSRVTFQGARVSG